MNARLFLPSILLALAAQAFASDPATSEPAPPLDSLDETMRQSAPELIKYLRDKKYANVGVLKFRVGIEGAAPSDNFGELNRNLASRLEVALVQNNPDQSLG